LDVESRPENIKPALGAGLMTGQEAGEIISLTTMIFPKNLAGRKPKMIIFGNGGALLT
jgi:hypothetical protein